jgi:mono/diheme cytochrome c family protein
MIVLPMNLVLPSLDTCMERPLRWILPLVILFLATLPVARAADPALAANVKGFEATVKPFLAQHCSKCHNAEKKKGDLTLHDLAAAAAEGKDLGRWTTIAERLKAGDMPPEGEPQPSPETIDAVTHWIDAELLKAGRTGAIRPGSLKTGNHVPHEWLFDASVSFPLDNPPRLWRLSPFIYETLAKDFSRTGKFSQPFALPAGEGFKDQSGSLGMDASTTAQLIRNAELFVDDQLGLNPKFGAGKKVSEFQPLLNETTPPTKAQIETAVQKQFDFALKRKATAEELTRFVEFHQKNVKTGGAKNGARITLMTILVLPEAVFRVELGAKEADTRKLLTPRELAFAIAYAITDRPPDATLLQAAASGKLKTKDDVAHEARRLLDDSNIDKPRILRFFREYFGYAEAINVFKNDKEFPGHKASPLVADTDRLINHVLRQDKDVFRELLTTNKSFVHHTRADDALKKITSEIKAFEQLKSTNPAKAKTRESPAEPRKMGAASYNLKMYVPSDQQPVDLPKEERAGILTQPSWLVAMSDNTDNHAIRRGKWIRERLLGGTVPDIPIGVDAQLPIAPEKTLRERMQVTREAYCWQCHAKMNPIGLGFEMYDHFGRYRKEELNKPVDASAVVDRVGDKTVEGTYPNAVDLIRKLASTARARQVFVRYAFRYWAGRDENLGDAKSLQQIDQAYVQSGGSMKAMIVAILTSDSFLYRTP